MSLFSRITGVLDSFQKIELESSRMATGPNERAVEFRIVAR